MQATETLPRVLSEEEQRYIQKFNVKLKTGNTIGFIVFLGLFLAIDGLYTYLVILSPEEMLKPLLLSVFLFINLVFIGGIILSLKILRKPKDLSYCITILSGRYQSQKEDMGESEYVISHYINSTLVIIPPQLIPYLNNGEYIHCEIYLIIGTKSILQSTTPIVLSINSTHHL